jgi:hypothetical protein
MEDGPVPVSLLVLPLSKPIDAFLAGPLCFRGRIMDGCMLREMPNL